MNENEISEIEQIIDQIWTGELNTSKAVFEMAQILSSRVDLNKLYPILRNVEMWHYDPKDALVKISFLDQ